MTSKEFVKEKYPKAIVTHHMTRDPFDKKGYWLCWEERRGTRLSEGISESNAWVNSFAKIINKKTKVIDLKTRLEKKTRQELLDWVLNNTKSF